MTPLFGRDCAGIIPPWPKNAEEMEVTEAYDKTQKAVVSKALQANESRPTNGEKREKKREKKVKKKQVSAGFF